MNDGDRYDLNLISLKDRGSSVGVFAIHGGKIDLGTGTMARLISGDDYSFYVYDGESSEDKVTSTMFDEQQALNLADSLDTIVSIHGEKDTDDEYVMLGGLNEELIKAISHKLSGLGILQKEPDEHLAGTLKENICNKGKSGRGVQIEMSRLLRKRFYEKPKDAQEFADAVRSALG
ncbi:MAG: poly-gamma-glutamate hydrolase family protein [bacterium]|nr:poly-gamma-glutamate hydrolase family protein [bacterium]